MKLFVLLSLLSLQAATALASDQDEDAATLVSFNNILTRLEENAPSTLFSLPDKLRGGIFARDSHLKEKRQEEGGSNLTSSSNSRPSSVPTVTVPTAITTSNSEPTEPTGPTNNPSPTETETETDTGSETPPTDSPTNTTPDQPTLTSSTSKKDPTTSNFQTQTRPSSSSSSTSSTSTTSEIITSSKISTSDTESTRALSSRTTLSTTTLPDGSKSTITAVTVVNPTAEVTAGGSNPTETRGAPGLQTGAAAGTMVSNNEFLALFGGAAVFALAF